MMLKRLPKPIAFLVSAFVIILLIAGKTAVVAKRTVEERAVVATAPSPPSLELAILNGTPIHVLYITQSEDTVLVRCYPGYEPTLSVRTMGNDPAADWQQEGVLTCIASES